MPSLESSSSPSKTPGTAYRVAIWTARIVVGLTFIVSGWAKAIDPWGFLIKVNEYLAAWGWSLPRELVLAPCIALSCIEFCIGVLVATGSLRRAAVWGAAVLMLFMTPLTLYIAIADPVADCGCFGDFLVISNWATFAKNIVLCGLIVWLLIAGKDVKGIYAAPIQWLVIVVSLVFTLYLSLVGFHVQPLVDFRPYRTGSSFAGSGGSDVDIRYIYEKDGERREFGLDNIPDSTWTFIEQSMDGDSDAGGYGFEIRDNDGYAVNEQFADNGSPMLLIVVPEPGIDFLSQAHLANRLAERAAAEGVDVYGIAGALGASLDRWVELVRPLFPVYSAEDTSLKQLVRGDAGAVFVDSVGTIMWKRTLMSVPRSYASASASGADDSLASLEPVDGGRTHAVALGLYAASMLLIWLLGLSPKIMRVFTGRTKKNA